MPQCVGVFILKQCTVMTFDLPSLLRKRALELLITVEHKTYLGHILDQLFCLSTFLSLEGEKNVG